MALKPHTSIHREMKQAEQKGHEQGFGIGLDSAVQYLAANGHQAAADLLDQVFFTTTTEPETSTDGR